MDPGIMQSTGLENSKEGSPQEMLLDVKPIRENIALKMKIPDKQEHTLLNKNEPKSSHSSNLSWPSLWKNGPRRSAFQPYKPSREVSVPRPASTTVMTNLQRGNIQAETALVSSDLSWFTLAGRGDITAEHLEEMVAQGKDIDCVDEEGLSGLMWAAYHGQIHTVTAILRAGGENGVEVDRVGMWGETALMLAATNGHLEIVRLLLAVGADVNHQDHTGETALMCAAFRDHPHTVSELLSNGADITLQNNSNCTAYYIAIEQQSLKSKPVLEKYMLSLLTMS